MIPVRINQRARYIAVSNQRREAARDAESLVNILNAMLDGAPYPALLKKLVETWIVSDYQIQRWRYRDYFERLVRKLPRRLTQRKSSPVHLDSGVDQQGAEALFGSGDVAAWENNQAVEIFLKFIGGPFFDRIAKCEKCAQFIFKTRSDKTYCSQACASSVTALKAHQAGRKQKRQVSIDKIRRALGKWNGSSKTDKTLWLHEKTGLSKKFVTIALRELGEHNTEVE